VLMQSRNCVSASICLVVLVGGSSFVLSEDLQSRPKPDGVLAKLLEDWSHQSSLHTNIEVHFTREDRDRSWEDARKSTGHLILLPKARALAELTSSDASGKVTNADVAIWDTSKFHCIRKHHNQHLISDISSTSQGRLPIELTLPFLWNLNTNDLKSRYQITLLGQSPEAAVLRFDPITSTERKLFSKMFVKVSTRDFSTRQINYISPDGKQTSIYHITKLKCDQPALETALADALNNSQDMKVIDKSQLQNAVLALLNWSFLPTASRN
jgi:hypothetical protein